ncbi:MAG: hypothetical protein ACTSYA_10915, partial [Candidatus Kariarchaeaceae archaeon]
MQKKQVMTYLTMVFMLSLFIIPPIAPPSFLNPPTIADRSQNLSEDQTTETISESLTSDQQSNYFNNPSFPGVSFLPSDHRDSSALFTYVNGETSVNTSLTNLVNNINVTVNPLDNYDRYNLTMGIDIFDPYEDNYIETTINTSPQDFANNKIFAQCTEVTELDLGATIDIQSFNITLKSPEFSPLDQQVAGEIWSALNDTGDIKPDSMLGTTTITISPTALQTYHNITFPFDQSVTITPDSTYVNSEGIGFFFFIVYPKTTLSENLWETALENHSNGNNGTTYITTQNSPPSLPPGSWGSEVLFDLIINYKSSIVFNANDIQTEIFTPYTSTSGTLVDTDDTFIENTNYTSTNTYRVKYNSSKTGTVNPVINITLTRFDFNKSAIVFSTFNSSADLSYVNWTLSISAINSGADSFKQYLFIPNHLQILSVQNKTTSTEFSRPSEWDYNSVNGNSTLFLKAGSGDYVINAYSSNMLSSATVSTFVDSGDSYEVSSIASMGVLFPASDTGDIVKTNVTNVGSLDLSGGNYNISLRNPSGAIEGLSYTAESTFSNSFSFEMTLEPDLTVGDWYFQIDWFNGSSAGSSSANISLIPQTNLEIISPVSPLKVLEEDLVPIEVKTIDLSHNSSWSSPGVYDWALESDIPLTYQGIRSDKYHNYTATIDTSIGNLPSIEATTYSITISFTSGAHTHEVSFSIVVYYRTDTTLQGINGNEIYYLESVTFNLTALDLTSGGATINSPDIQFSILYPYSSVYDASTGIYNLTISWTSDFTIGSNNLAIKWQLTGYREEANDPWTETTYSFDVLNRPVYRDVETVTFNGSVLTYLDSYDVYFSVKDGFDDTKITTGNLANYAVKTNLTSTDIDVSFSQLADGTFKATFQPLKTSNDAFVQSWTFSATGYDDVEITFIFTIQPREVESNVFGSTEIDSTQDAQVYVAITDSNGTLIFVNEISDDPFELTIFSFEFNGSGIWSANSDGFMIIDYNPTVFDAGTVVSLNLTVSMYGYNNHKIIIYLTISPLIETSYEETHPVTLEYYETGEIRLRFIDNNSVYLISYNANVTAIYNLSSFDFIEIITLANGQKVVHFRINDTVLNERMNLTIVLYLEGYETKTFEISIALEKAQVDFEVFDSSEMTYTTESFNISINLSTHGQTVPTDLEITSSNSTNEPVWHYGSTYMFLVEVTFDTNDVYKVIIIRIEATSNLLTGYYEITILVNARETELTSSAPANDELHYYEEGEITIFFIDQSTESDIIVYNLEVIANNNQSNFYIIWSIDGVTGEATITFRLTNGATSNILNITIILTKDGYESLQEEFLITMLKANITFEVDAPTDYIIYTNDTIIITGNITAYGVQTTSTFTIIFNSDNEPIMFYGEENDMFSMHFNLSTNDVGEELSFTLVPDSELINGTYLIEFSVYSRFTNGVYSELTELHYYETGEINVSLIDQDTLEIIYEYNITITPLNNASSFIYWFDNTTLPNGQVRIYFRLINGTLNDQFSMTITLSLTGYKSNSSTYYIEMLLATPVFEVNNPDQLVYSVTPYEFTVNVYVYGELIETNISIFSYNSTLAPLVLDGNETILAFIQLSLHTDDTGFVLSIIIETTSPLLNGTIELQITIFSRFTYANITGSDSLHYYENGTIIIGLYDSETNITLEDILFEIISPEGGTIEILEVTQLENNRTMIIFRVVEFDETLEIEINLSKHLYESQTVTFSIDMLLTEAEIDVDAPESIVYSTEALEIEITITAYGLEIPTGINFDNYNSSNAPILISSDGSTFTIELTLEASDAGYIIVITITPTSPLLEGSYQIVIEIVNRATDYTCESPEELYYFEEGNMTITFSDGLVNETLEDYQWIIIAEGNEQSFMIVQSQFEDGILTIIFYANDSVQSNQLNITITLNLEGY